MEDEYLWLVPYWKAPFSANDILHQKQKIKNKKNMGWMI